MDRAQRGLSLRVEFVCLLLLVILGKYPGGESRDQIITAMDWLPTIMDLCGIKYQENDPKLDGYSVVKILENPRALSGNP